MSASHFFSKTGVTLVAIESTYGTAPTGVRAAIDVEQSDLQFAQGSVAPMPDSIRPWRTAAPIPGPKSGTGKIVMDARPQLLQATAGVTPTDNYLQQMLKAILGGHWRGAGSLVVGTSITTSLDITGGTGVEFLRGQWLAAEVGGALEYARAKQIATDDITPAPSFSGAPTSGGIVVNGDTFYMSAANTQSLTVQHGMVGDSNRAWTIVGATGDLEVMLDSAKLLQFGFNLRYPKWTESTAGAASPAISLTTAFTETLATQMLVTDPCTCLVQATTALTKTHYPIEVSGFKLNLAGLGNTHIKQLGGGVQNTTGVVRLPSREDNTLELTVPSDTAFTAGFLAGTKYAITLQVLSGSGLTQRACIIDCPTAILTEIPGTGNADNGRFTTKLKFKLMESEINTISGLTNGTAAMEAATSPCVITLL